MTRAISCQFLNFRQGKPVWGFEDTAETAWMAMKSHSGSRLAHLNALRPSLPRLVGLARHGYIRRHRIYIQCYECYTICMTRFPSRGLVIPLLGRSVFTDVVLRSIKQNPLWHVVTRSPGLGEGVRKTYERPMAFFGCIAHYQGALLVFIMKNSQWIPQLQNLGNPKTRFGEP